MITDRNKYHFVTICCWLHFLTYAVTDVQALAVAIQQTHKDDVNGLQDATVRTFSPRVDYNNHEWRPVGRGDPLKNDPTFDYSPPALERVRYWGDASDKDSKEKDKEQNAGTSGTDAAAVRKNEILLLGVGNERVRGNALHMVKNVKGETPLLQPKYTSIRRSYYAHQLPTHLMPPPMQTISPPQHMLKSTAPTTSPTMNMMMHSKPHHSTMATSPWLHKTTMTHLTHHMPTTYDSHHQGSVNYFSYTRPSMATAQLESYSPNAIRSPQNFYKQSPVPRKPWVHELLQKEVVKPHSLMATKPLYEPMSSIGISTTYSPALFETSTMHSPRPSYTPSTIFITPTTPLATTSSRTPIHIHTTTQSPSSTTTTSNRLLIPTTSNLAHRPTVAPMEATTDSLFSHYHQPDRPLVGPMYLIIEGHSKVKTYGKNELDPHQPKIVPIIPKREPVVRIGDPNEKRGTVETFQVKHLHTKTTPPTTTTTTPSTHTTSTTTQAAFTTTPKLETTTTTTRPTFVDHPPTEPPTGMQGLLSLLDSSLGSIFQDESIASAEAAELKAPQQQQIYVTPPTTMLHPVTTSAKPSAQLPQVEPRIGAGTITSIMDTEDDYNDPDDTEGRFTTESSRLTRQVFDYDQLPNAIKVLADSDEYEEDDVEDEDDDDDDGEQVDDVENDEELEQITFEKLEEEDDGHTKEAFSHKRAN